MKRAKRQSMVHISRMFPEKRLRCSLRLCGFKAMASLFIYFYISVMVFKVKGCNISLDNNQEESREVTARGYGYGGFGYPFLPFLEPLSILAVIGFLAFLIQTFHAIYHTHNHGGLAGGLLNNVLPGHNKKLESESRQYDNIFKSINYYESLNNQNKPKNRRKFVQGNNIKSPTRKNSN